LLKIFYQNKNGKKYFIALSISIVLFSCSSNNSKNNDVYNEDNYVLNEIIYFENTNQISGKLFYYKTDTSRIMRLTYYENDTLRSKEFYLHKKLHGPFWGFDEDGILFFKGYFEYGVPLQDSTILFVD